MAYSWATTLLFLYCSSPSSSGQTISTDGPTDLPTEGWIVVGVIIFAIVFILSVTWVLFISAMCKTEREYRTFLKSLKKYRRRRLQNQQRRQARSLLEPGRSRQPTPARTPAHTRPLPRAISYRRDLQSPAEIYVSLAQLTTMLRGTQPLNIEPWRTRERRQEEPTPSAPPFPDSLPDYYEFMSQEHEQMYTQEQPHQLLEEETEFDHEAEEQLN